MRIARFWIGGGLILSFFMSLRDSFAEAVADTKEGFHCLNAVSLESVVSATASVDRIS